MSRWVGQGGVFFVFGRIECGCVFGVFCCFVLEFLGSLYDVWFGVVFGCIL